MTFTKNESVLARMNNPIKISIGIPIFRPSPSIELSLQSAFSQSRPADEIVICDNLVDRPREDALRWQSQKNVKYINSGVNIGADHNFIRAWESSESRYFLWLADDDILHPEALAYYEDQILSTRANNIVAWTGFPASHSFGRPPILNYKKPQSINDASPHRRIRSAFLRGKWNHLIYSIYDKRSVSVDFLKHAHDWPLHVRGVDWGWTFYVASLGSISIMPGITYFYNCNNWLSPTPPQVLLDSIPNSSITHNKSVLNQSEIYYLSARVRDYLVLCASHHYSEMDLCMIFDTFFTSARSLLSADASAVNLKLRIPLCRTRGAILSAYISALVGSFSDLQWDLSSEYLAYSRNTLDHSPVFRFKLALYSLMSPIVNFGDRLVPRIMSRLAKIVHVED